MKRNNKTCKIEGKSLIRQISIDSIKIAVSNSLSFSSTLLSLGLDVKTIYLNTLREIVELNNINVSHFSRKNVDNNKNKYIVNDIEKFRSHLVEDSKIDKNTLKSGIIRYNLIERKCLECKITNEYNNKPITLQLDHINGINNDNRLLNLRYLCPNCHSQSDTFSGRNNRVLYELRYCSCGLPISRKSKTGKCSKCRDWKEESNSYVHSKKFEVSKEELEQLIKEKPMTEIGKMFGVSDNAIKKRCKKLEINLPNRLGYWSKIKSGK